MMHYDFRKISKIPKCQDLEAIKTGSKKRATRKKASGSRQNWHMRLIKNKSHFFRARPTGCRLTEPQPA